MSSSSLAREAYSSLSLTEAWYPFRFGVYLDLTLVAAGTYASGRGTLPGCHCIYSVDEVVWELIQLKPLSDGRLIKDIEGFGMESGEVCIKEDICLHSRGRRSAVYKSKLLARYVFSDFLRSSNHWRTCSD